MTPPRAKRTKVVILISHPIQHFVPIFRHLSRFEDVAVTVCYYDYDPAEKVDLGFGSNEAWDIDLTSGYDFIPLKVKPSGLSRLKSCLTFLEHISGASPDVILTFGYTGLACRLAYLWNFWRRPMIHYGDSELLHRRSWPARLFKMLTLPFYFAGCSRVLTIGDENRRYYRHYGVPERKLVRSVCPIDLIRFKETIARCQGEGDAKLKERWKIDADATVLLFIGRFVAIKRPLDVIEAMARLTPSDPKMVLLMIGNGPTMPDIQAKVKASRVEDRVRVVGFVNQSEIPAYMNLGDVVVSASELDPHPLVITEAMAAGNAVVASDRVGCVGAGDTARPGVNTLVFRCGDPDDLVRALREAVKDGNRLEAMQEKSREIAESQDATVAAATFREAVLAAARVL